MIRHGLTALIAERLYTGEKGGTDRLSNHEKLKPALAQVVNLMV